MWSLISKLQKKPEPERKRILFLTAGSITVVIAGIWLISFYFNVLAAPKVTKTAETSPLISLKENLSNAYQSISEMASTTFSIATTTRETSTTTSSSTGSIVASSTATTMKESL